MITFEIKSNKVTTTKWEDIPQGVFAAKQYDDTIWAKCVWLKMGNELYFLQNLSTSRRDKPVKFTTPSDMVDVEPIEFKGI